MELSRLDISKAERDVIIAQTQLDILEAEQSIGATDEATVEAARRDFLRAKRALDAVMEPRYRAVVNDYIRERNEAAAAMPNPLAPRP